MWNSLILGGHFGYFLIFLLGEWEFEAAWEGGGRILIENHRGGGLHEGERAEGPGGCLRRIGDFGGGGGSKYFFSGAEMSSKHSRRNYYSQLSYFSELISITVTVIIFPGINYKTVMW